MKKYIIAILSVLIIFTFSGCGMGDLMFSNLKGELVGNSFEISVHDNFGNLVTSSTGKKVSVAAVAQNGAEGTNSSYIETFIDGRSMMTVGSTVLYVESGIVAVQDWSLPTEMVNQDASTGFIPFDRIINDIDNFMGKARIVVVQSQLGVPIAVYAGDEVSMIIPENLPKITKLSIDGKALYVHRANCIIIDAQLVK